jgi:hypothetical protein
VELDFRNRGVYYFGEFEEGGLLCYIDDQVLLGCETAVVGFGAFASCFLKMGGLLYIIFIIGCDTLFAKNPFLWGLVITSNKLRSRVSLCLCELFGRDFEQT